MRNLTLIATFLYVFTNTYAGDTIFTNLPNFRKLNSSYMQKVFLDEFTGSNLNTNIWYIEQCEGRGFDENLEGEPNNVKVSNGKLNLIVRYDPGNIDNNCYLNNHFTSNYTAAEIWSRWARFKYGYFEAKCFMPAGSHSYYAYWLNGPSADSEIYPKDGYTSEIDIAEGCEWEDGSHHEMKSTFHNFMQGGNEISLPTDATHGLGTYYENGWHTYKIIWNPYEVIFYIDNVEKWRRSRFYYGNQDLTQNDVGSNNIQINTTYHERSWFPNDYMATVLQMHIQKN